MPVDIAELLIPFRKTTKSRKGASEKRESKGGKNDKGGGIGKRNDWRDNGWEKKNRRYASDWKGNAADKTKSSDEPSNEKTPEKAKKKKAMVISYIGGFSKNSLPGNQKKSNSLV